jgi:hypothetical protein
MFGGLIQKEGHSTYPAIRDTPYGKSDYFVLNFNDTVLSLGTLFVLLLVSNMHNIATGFTAVTEGASTKLFFISWYCIGTLLLLNLLMASLLTSLISFWFSRKNSGQTNPDDDNTVDETGAEQMAEGSETASVDSIPEGSNDYDIRATCVSLGDGDVGYIVKEDNIFATVPRPSRLRDELDNSDAAMLRFHPSLCIGSVPRRSSLYIGSVPRRSSWRDDGDAAIEMTAAPSADRSAKEASCECAESGFGLHRKDDVFSVAIDGASERQGSMSVLEAFSKQRTRGQSELYPANVTSGGGGGDFNVDDEVRHIQINTDLSINICE